MTRNSLIGAALALALGAGATHAAADTAVVYKCANGTLVIADFGVERGRVLLTIGKHRVMLARVKAASGAKYTNGKTTFWTKGDNARLLDAGRETTCRAADD